MNFNLFIILLLALGINAKSQPNNPPVPFGYPSFQFNLIDSSFNGYLSTTTFPTWNTRSQDRYLSILDENGYLVWYAVTNSAYLDFKYQDSLQLFTFQEPVNLKYPSCKIIDTAFTVIDSLSPSAGLLVDTHEFLLLDNGYVILSARSDSVVDLSQDSLNGALGSDTTHIRGFVIQEYDNQRNLVFNWDSNDFLDPLESYEKVYGYNVADFDYCHGNAIEKDQDGNYLVSMRHTNSIYKIDKQNGAILWKLGGKQSDFTFVNDSGFSGQHDCRRLANGNLSLFDNSNMSARKKSRAVEYVLDTITWTATKVWEHQYDTGFFARAMGSYQTTESKTKVINYGLVYRPYPSFIILDSSDQLQVECFFKDSVVSYRTLNFEPKTALSRTNVSCDNQNGILTLTATGGTSYVWNTGDTTATITVINPGVYQVWANKGIGMMGSRPIVIDTVLNFCNLTSITTSNQAPQIEKKVFKIYDLIGREVNKPVPNRIYIILYTDGSSEKRYWNKGL